MHQHLQNAESRTKENRSRNWEDKKQIILAKYGKQSKQGNIGRVLWSPAKKIGILLKQNEADPNTGNFRQPTQDETFPVPKTQ